jgi:hypothetical protein
MSRPKAYKGNEPYLFVSYCHKDDARVWPMIEGLQARGMRVWYDEGIEWGSHWDQVIFEHLSNCAYVVAFVTENFLHSENCQDEISYAKDEQKGPFIVFLDNMELTGMMKFRYGRLQALNASQFDRMDALLDILSETQTLSNCRDAVHHSAVQQGVTSSLNIKEVQKWNQQGEELYFGREYEKAMKLFAKAAEQGLAVAQHNLAMCYFNGHVVKNETLAVKWLRQAAEQGFDKSQHELAYCYSRGEGVSRDPIEMVKWWKKAAEQGYAPAQACLAACYEYGSGVARDETEAAKWHRKAAKQGLGGSQVWLKERNLAW